MAKMKIEAVNNRHHIIEAECGNCGEHYNPESLEKGWVEHYECEELGEGLGTPRQIWIYNIYGHLLTKKKKFKMDWKEVWAVLGVSLVAIWFAWMFLG